MRSHVEFPPLNLLQLREGKVLPAIREPANQDDEEENTEYNRDVVHLSCRHRKGVRKAVKDQCDNSPGAHHKIGGKSKTREPKVTVRKRTAASIVKHDDGDDVAKVLKQEPGTSEGVEGSL